VAKGAEKEGREPAPSNKWWVDTGKKEKVREKPVAGPAGMGFFQVAHDFDQERARERLNDNNLKLLVANNPEAGVWSYVCLTESQFPQRELDRVKQLVALPPYARGLVVDSGRSIRLLVTGTPVGERILELSLGESPSFDCWINQDWVKEALFNDAEKALRAFRRFIQDFLSPDGIARWESTTARA